ncbi:MAG: sel1 repeat family protein, partial [Gammaproteobacteria bacterium]|nr:sel1 repeat family protein [Gammaproteobacteria bacterium]
MMRLLDGTILRSNNQRDAYSQAECYREGRLVTASERRALALYHRAAEEGDARAYFRLGQHEQAHLRWNSAFELFLQAGLRGNNDVIAWLDTLVSQNNAEAALVLGKITQYKRQYDQAIQSYTKAHELNHPDGMFYFGKMYSNLTNTQTRGIDITNRYRDSARLGSKHGLNELLLLSASNGKASLHLAQMYELGEVVHKNLLKAIELYEKSSQQNCSDATYYLAELYARGTQEVAVDISKACRYYLIASQQGQPSAISSWRALAQRGSAEAQYRLGYDYYRTLSLGSRNYSTQYDIPNAVTWCVKAEIQGHASAAAYLSGKFTAEIFWKIANEYVSSTLNVERCQQKAVEYGMKASDLGFKEASRYLAELFYEGSASIQQDVIKSFNYLVTATKQGDSSALNILASYATAGDKEAQFVLAEYYRELGQD